MQILLADSSLEFLPGDSAATNLVVIVRDLGGVEMAGVEVSLAVLQPGIARVFFLDELRVDTTNSYGAVGCMLSSWGREGIGEVQALAAGIAAHPVAFSIAARDISGWYLGLSAFPDTLFVEPENLGRDSVRIVAGLSDELGQAVANAKILFSGFAHDESTQRTNRVGQADVWYRFETYGMHHVTARLGELEDRVEIILRRR